MVGGDNVTLSLFDSLPLPPYKRLDTMRSLATRYVSGKIRNFHKVCHPPAKYEICSQHQLILKIEINGPMFRTPSYGDIIFTVLKKRI